MAYSSIVAEKTTGWVAQVLLFGPGGVDDGDALSFLMRFARNHRLPHLEPRWGTRP